MQRDEVAQRAQQKQTLMIDPQDMLEYYFVERDSIGSIMSEDPEILLKFMSRDDIRWFERNEEYLADIAPSLGLEAPGEDLSARRNAAIQVATLYRIAKRPIVSSIQLVDDYVGVAFVHLPGRPETFREVFIINENGEWRIRRFAGRRDDPELLHALVAYKKEKGITLTDEDLRFEADPTAYVNEQRNALLTEVGLPTTPH